MNTDFTEVFAAITDLQQKVSAFQAAVIADKKAADDLIAAQDAKDATDASLLEADSIADSAAETLVNKLKEFGIGVTVSNEETLLSTRAFDGKLLKILIEYGPQIIKLIEMLKK